MSPTLLYEIAAVLFVVFAAGHTLGFLKLTPPTAEGVAARDAMNNAHFQIGGTTVTYGRLYTGFGLYMTVYLLFSAYLAWHLGVVAARDPAAIGTLGWVFFAVQLANVALAWIYFFLPPRVLSILIVLCVGWACLLVR